MSSHSEVRSPRLDALLSALKRRLVRLVWMHGVGTFVAAFAGWLLFAFLADWLLHVPAPVRLFHTAMLVAVPVFFLRRDLLQLLRRVPGRDGLAMLFDKRHPENREIFTSAVQLAPQADGPARPLIERIVADAEERTARVALQDVVDPSGPRRRASLGAGALVVSCAALLASPDLTSIFFRRMLGGNVAWPQRTHLTVEIPIVGERAQVETVGDPTTDILVRVARGSDVPVLVHVDGVVPDEITLHFSGGHTVVVTSGGMRLVRTLLPSVQEDVEFYVTGGDDEAGVPVVRLTVLQPPDVSGLAVAIEPPAYSGLAPSVEFDTDVEVIEGSRLAIRILPDPEDATGVARLLPEDREIALVPAPFPARPDDESVAPTRGLGFQLVATESLRYRFELIDKSGLPNPDPGLFGVQVIEDRRPEVQLLSPGRAEIDVVAGGALGLRVRVEDDFGVGPIEWSVRETGDEATLLATGSLPGQTVVPVEDAYRGTRRAVVVGRARLEVNDLAGGGELFEGQQLVLQATAVDNREPQPNEAPSAPVRLRVVSSDEFLRRLQDRLARAGEQANRLAGEQEEKLRRTRDILAALSSDDLDVSDPVEVSSLLTGERRVQGDARALGRDLAGIAESLLYSRVDERAGPLLDAIDQRLAEHEDRSFHPEPWRELARRYAAKELGSAGLAGQLVGIVGIALDVSEEHTLAAADALARAQETTGPAGVQAAIAEAYEHQTTAMEAIERLLEQLAGWDNYQSVLTQVRDALKAQKNLMERTRQFAKDN